MKIPAVRAGSFAPLRRTAISPAAWQQRQSSLYEACTRTRATSSRQPKSRNYSTINAGSLYYGQPIFETHPHLLKAGEITPGITAQEYHERRARLAQSLDTDGVAILASAEIVYRSGAVFHPFRQESNFLYLTGFKEPESLAIIRKTGPDFGDYEFTLFARPKDPKAEQWNGPWSGLQAAQDVFNADVARDIYAANTELASMLKGVTKVYSDIPAEQRIAGKPYTSYLTKTPSPLTPTIHALRAIKSEAEIACMRHAGRQSGRAITQAMRTPHHSEDVLADYLNAAFYKKHCDGPAYIPVVAGGPRSLLIHYTQNNRQLRDGELVVVDAGAEYGTYVADITRTWPTGPGAESGRFSAAQRDLYEAVLRVQRTGVSLCRASAGMSLDRIHAATRTALARELEKIGFAMRGGEIDILFPHHVGHYVGLDVHDVPTYGRAVNLQKGHCVTIEPGVYVPDDERFPASFRGMGIRIEDSICVGEEDPYVLTTEAVKEVVDIEAARYN